METVIRLNQLCRQFGNQMALDRVSFEVPQGSIFALLGENGAGKTTAIRILLGLLEPTAGSVEVLGMDPTRQGQQVRRSVGYLPEQPSLYDWMTVLEIGQFTSAFYDRAAFLPRYQRLMSELSLPGGKKLKTLSKGTRAKVALALALAQDPELLVLDEPTSGLDLLVRREILDRLVDLSATGHTVLLSSHQIAEVERVADFVAIIHLGQLVALAPLEQLKEQTQELTLTVNGDASAPPPIAGEVLRERSHARQWQILVRGCPPEQVDRLRGDAHYTSVEVRTPALEEIVASYLQAKPQTNRVVAE